MKIVIETIDHKDQAYPTVGNYWISDEDGSFHIVVSHTEDKYDQAVILHELVELFAVINKGISIDSIDAFDKEFESVRENFPTLIGNQEPGNMISAPYHEEHKLATAIEKIFCAASGIEWSKYEEVLNNL